MFPPCTAAASSGKATLNRLFCDLVFACDLGFVFWLVFLCGLCDCVVWFPYFCVCLAFGLPSLPPFLPSPSEQPVTAARGVPQTAVDSQTTDPIQGGVAGASDRTATRARRRGRRTGVRGSRQRHAGPAAVRLPELWPVPEHRPRPQCTASSRLPEQPASGPGRLAGVLGRARRVLAELSAFPPPSSVSPLPLRAA